MGNLAIGSHVGGDDPIAKAQELGLDHIQIFLADPQGWKGSVFPHADGAEGLKASSEAANIGIYVHARYIINVATTNNKVRIPSRKLLQTDVDAAAAVGAKAVIVHGGHVTDGGKNSMARRLESIKGLWGAVGDTGVGFCLDTCHAHAGGIDMGQLAETILGITGRIDLIHCNDSRDSFDSGADRHANLGEGSIGMDNIINCLKTAKAPIVLETPFEGVPADLELLRKSL
jgi:deoxyribonuclease-4